MRSLAKENKDNSILFNGYEYGMCKDFYKWMGWDILFNAATKTAKALAEQFGTVSLSFVRIPDEAVVNTKEVLSQFGDARFDHVEEYLCQRTSLIKRTRPSHRHTLTQLDGACEAG